MVIKLACHWIYTKKKLTRNCIKRKLIEAIQQQISLGILIKSTI